MATSLHKSKGAAGAAAGTTSTQRAPLAGTLLLGLHTGVLRAQQLDKRSAGAGRPAPAVAGRRTLGVCRAAEPDRMSSTSSRGGASHSPMAFHEQDYHRVSLCSAPYGPMKLFEDSRGGTFNGVLVFKRNDADTHSGDDVDVLEVFVAGDTAYNTWSLLTHRQSDRPMVHDLMWNLLERAHGSDARNWALLRVAIVELRENVFIGRLFFGDKETGEVLWDCDCRPSDGVYLSLRSEAPFFVHRRVWDQAALPVRSSSVYKLVASSTTTSTSSSTTTSTATTSSASTPAPSYQDPPPFVVKSGSPGGSFSQSDDEESGRGRHTATTTPGRGGRAGREGPGAWQGKPANPLATAESLSMEDVTLIRPDDPDAIKLLKRQLLVAVAEEDYREAARLRDHAWMHLYKDVHVLRLRGRYEDAHRVEMELRRQIEAVASFTEQH